MRPVRALGSGREEMNMKVKLIKQIHSCFASMCSEDITVEMDIEIPVCPQIGWDVLDDEIREIWWDGKDLNCFVEADNTFYDVHTVFYRATKEQMDELCIGYIERGWRVR